ncbi:MAG: hypothetical protein AB7Q29_11515 [Vicinamibacterales bacterium]
MAPDRRRLVLLVSILIVVSLVGAYQYWPGASPAGGGVPARGAAGQGGAVPALEAPDVRLRVLNERRPAPEAVERNPFRYGSTRRPAREAPAPRPMTRDDAPPPVETPSGPPAVPPIAMRFIGLVEATEHEDRIAILSDGRGIYRGREGDIIEGRYRILRIGGESVDMAYLDGRGRQTIRLSGS